MRDIKEARRVWNSPGKPARTRRHAAALTLVLAACAGDSGRDGPSPSELERRAQDEHSASGAGVDHFGVLDDSGISRPRFADCVASHVAAAGGAHAVTHLECLGKERVDCVAEPELDLSLLAPLENLRFLDLSYRCVRDIAPLAKLGGLEVLKLRGNDVEDIRPLGALVGLRSLDLADNPLEATWGFKTKEPFSRWSRLEELDLGQTFLANILPLEVLTSLRVLDLSDCGVFSIRPLRTLTNLEELYIDHIESADLVELGGMTQLKVLSAKGSKVSSIEPLRGLAARGRLQTVSLDQNCISGCEELDVPELSCADQNSTCTSVASRMPASALSVPVASVEQFPPPADLPLWSEDQVIAAFDLVSTTIRWDEPRGGCDTRASHTARILGSADYPRLTWVYAFGNLRPLTKNDPSGFVAFDWHVAAAVRTQQGFVVLDPALEPRPLPLREWYARTVDSADADLNFSCREYMGDPLNGTDARCGANSSVMIDARGNLSVDDLRDVRGTICAAPGCEP